MITEFDGTLAVEPAIRFNKDHRVIPEPIPHLYFYPQGDINKALNLDPLFGQVYILDLIEQLRGGKTKMASLIVYPFKPAGCLLKLNEDPEPTGCLLDLGEDTDSSLDEYERFLINYADPEMEPYFFQAKSHIVAVRSFLDLFKSLSSMVDRQILDSFGIKSLTQSSMSKGLYQVFPHDDQDYNARCHKLFIDYRELKDKNHKLLF
ncbi:MAG: hypothetical protein WCP93_03760 [Candidatus Berkelbacteria bacterium]